MAENHGTRPSTAPTPKWPRPTAEGDRISKYRIDAEVRVKGGLWTAFSVAVDSSAGTPPSARKAAFDIKHNESRIHGVIEYDVHVRKTKVTPLD